MSLIYDVDFNSGTRVLSLLDKAGNVISSCEVPSKELVDDPNKPLMLRAIEDNSSVTLNKSGTLSNTYQTSTNGTDWTDYELGTRISLNKGESVYFRCSNHPTTQTDFDYVCFFMRGKIEAWHNAYSMISSDFSSAEASVGEYGLACLFEYCESLTKAPLLLNTLADYCYYGTFIGCISLTKAPSLPATNLARGCYQVMFWGCASLTQAPELPATTLADNCYQKMFGSCSKLKEVRISATKTATSALERWLENVAATGDFYCDPNATIFPTDSESGIPANWRRLNIDEEPPAVDDITKPLTFKATQDGSTVKLDRNNVNVDGSFETSRDGGNTWEDYTIGSRIALNTGDEVSFRVKANRSPYQYAANHYYFMMGGKIEAWHNVMSLYRKDDFATYDTAVGSLFAFLFQNCASLTKAPVLPATTLEDSCYTNMFDGCKSLTKAPVLPATTLAQNCYAYMFQGCQSLTKAPELPATTLDGVCYDSMFSGCRSLKEVRVSATTTARNALHNWLSGVSATGDFYCDPNATIFPTGASGIPANWRRLNINEEGPAVDDITKPLTFKATQDGSTVKLTKRNSPAGAFQTSGDGGNTWTDYTINTAITLNTGDEVSFRAKADRTSAQRADNYFYFEMTGKIEAWHNVMSMLIHSDFATYDTVFERSLDRMFKGCTSLTKAPKLPATTLAPYCFDCMFEGCTSLTEAPDLPATTLAVYCYAVMFGGCHSLTKAPELSATTLKSLCYTRMFEGCHSLTKAPELPATTLVQGCYDSMFSGCQSLKEVRISATTITPEWVSALSGWLSDVSATGDFYCKPNATIFPTGTSGIPKGWRRLNINDYPN